MCASLWGFEPVLMRVVRQIAIRVSRRVIAGNFTDV
jgi:hypothetical protein